MTKPARYLMLVAWSDDEGKRGLHVEKTADPREPRQLPAGVKKGAVEVLVFATAEECSEALGYARTLLRPRMTIEDWSRAIEAEIGRWKK